MLHEGNNLKGPFKIQINQNYMEPCFSFLDDNTKIVQ